jgi:Icc-related predicted phosphoesterase
MRILAVADLHYSLPQFDWLVRMAPRYDVVVIAGDLMDAQSFVTTSAQMVVLLKYLQRLRELTTLIVCSGNHDLDHKYSTGERYARWVQHARNPSVHVDGDMTMIGGIGFSTFAWWDGDIAKNAIGRQLTKESAGRPERWIWIYHAPPAKVPVSWSGNRYFGDDALTDWIAEHKPDIVLCGHVHEAPFVSGGSWVSRVGDTWVFNAGRQIGDMPTHIAIDTEVMEGAWFSIEGVQTIALGAGPAEAQQATAMPAWMP